MRRWFVVALAACSTDEVEDPSYLLVQLDPVPVGALVPGAARVVVRSGTTTIAAACVNLGDGAGATLALKRDPAKNQDTRITIEVSGYETLSGQTNVSPGDEFTCPPELPPALAPAQTVSVSFCSTQAKRVVFHVGATCGCSGDGGLGGAGGSSSSAASTGSAGASGSGGTAGAGGTDGGGGAGGAGGSGGATVGAGGGGGASGGATGGAGGNSGAGGASSSSSSSASSSSSSSAGSGGAGGGPTGCGCGPAQTCGAGLSTEGRTCGPSECCSINVSTPCALEAAAK